MVAYEISGPDDAPVLLLSNALGATRGMWDAQVVGLGDELRLVRYDNRGHGDSPSPPGPYALADLAADALGLLDELGVERAHVCGLSLGGMVAMHLAGHHPERVQRLALISTAAALAPAQAWLDRADQVRREGPAAVADGIVTRWLTPPHAAAHPETVARLRAMIAGAQADGYAACCEAVSRVDLRPVLQTIAAPTLVVGAVDDPVAPPERAQELAQAIPGARLELVAQAAHMVVVEQAQRVNSLLKAHFLR
jgi:3-oxoadipate enol-lactonase